MYTYAWLFERKNHVCKFWIRFSLTNNNILGLLNSLEDEIIKANEVNAVGLYIVGPARCFTSPNLLI